MHWLRLVLESTAPVWSSFAGEDQTPVCIYSRNAANTLLELYLLLELLNELLLQVLNPLL